MAIEDRRLRDRSARRALIVATARALAEREGWDAVTTRRLSTEIEYSQPVIYKHFSSMEDVAAAVALEGFAELADVLAVARLASAASPSALRTVAHAFHRYAQDNPALYDAMFTRDSPLPFGDAGADAAMVAAFGEMRDAVAAAIGEGDVETLTEVLWAALHGLITLGRNSRLRRGLDDERIDRLVDQFIAAHVEDRVHPGQ